MRYLSVEFIFRVRTEAQFPRYTGSMLRGALGNSLRHAVCVMPGKDCPDCMLGGTCAFPKLFTFVVAPKNSRSAPMMPPPFCIEPPPEGIGDFVPGDTFGFTLKLFSYAVDYLPYFIHAFKLAGERGMGRGIAEGRGRLSLADVRQGKVSIYDAGNEQLLPHQADDLRLPQFGDATDSSRLILELRTPLRFKQANKLAADLDFPLLLRLILRRLANLEGLERREFRLPPTEFVVLRDVASTVRTQAAQLRWHDWRRYSGRQNTAMQLGGIMGWVSYAGPLEAFAEYLDFAAKVHLGKQTSFGLGALSLSWDDVNG